MNEVSRLMLEHAALARQAARISGIVSGDQPASLDELAALQDEFTSALIAHLAAEDVDIYPVLLKSSDRRIAHIARAFCDEMGSLAAAYGNYRKRWTIEMMSADWIGFRKATAELFDLLAIRILRENRTLYPLIARANETDRAA